MGHKRIGDADHGYLSVCESMHANQCSCHVYTQAGLVFLSFLQDYVKSEISQSVFSTMQNVRNNFFADYKLAIK